MSGIQVLRVLASNLIPQVDLVESIINEYDQTLHALLQSSMSTSDVDSARARLFELRAKNGERNMSMINLAGLGTPLSGITMTSASTNGNVHAFIDTPSTTTSTTSRPPFSGFTSRIPHADASTALSLTPAVAQRSTEDTVAASKRTHSVLNDDETSDKRRRLNQPNQHMEPSVLQEQSLSAADIALRDLPSQYPCDFAPAPSEPIAPIPQPLADDHAIAPSAPNVLGILTLSSDSSSPNSFENNQFLRTSALLSDNSAAEADELLAELDESLRSQNFERVCELYFRLREHPGCSTSALGKRCSGITGAFGKLRRFEEAEGPARRAFEFLGDQSVSAHDILASVLWKLGPNRSPEALEHINRALSLCTMNNDARHAAIRTKLIRIRDELLTARSHSTGPTNTNAVNTSSTGASAIQDSTTSAQQYVEPAAPAKRQLTATEMAHRKEFFDSRLARGPSVATLKAWLSTNNCPVSGTQVDLLARARLSFTHGTPPLCTHCLGSTNNPIRCKWIPHRSRYECPGTYTNRHVPCPIKFEAVQGEDWKWD